MFFISSQNTENPKDVRFPMVTRKSSSEHAHTIFSRYRLEAPFQLTFITFRPEDVENHFAISMLAPDYMTYTSLHRNEIEPYLSSKMHQHDFFELMFVLNGSVYQRIEDKRHFYPTGSCCLLNHNVQHTEEYSSDFRLLFLEMSDEFLQDVFHNLSLNYFQVELAHQKTDLEKFLSQNIDQKENYDKNYIDFIPTRDDGWIIQNVHQLFEQISQELLHPHLGSSVLVKGYFFKLLNLLSDPDFYTTTPIQIGTQTENAIFNQITDFMAETDGRITRTALSELMNYSGVYLNNITKKYTGLTLFDYGMTFCMKKAIEYLLDSSMSVTEISMALGFTNRNHFYKIFERAYHMTPVEYRKRHRHD